MASGYRRIMVRLRRSTPGRAGVALDDPEAAERIAALAIPPAWTDVWVSADPRGHIQATGVDVAGRTQYLYHPAWREHRDREKFDRALELARLLPGARGVVTRELRAGGLGKARVLAAAFRILDEGSLRVGGEEYLQSSGARGLTTLDGAHVRTQGDVVRFRFPGKSGRRWERELRDPDLAQAIAELKAGRSLRPRLLAWRDEDGLAHPLSAAEVNEDIRERLGGEYTAKDFRTLTGTVEAARFLAEAGPAASTSASTRTIAAACRHVAEVLGNTPAVARSSYIDPRVLDRYRSGQLLSAEPGEALPTALKRLIGS